MLKIFRCSFIIPTQETIFDIWSFILECNLHCGHIEEIHIAIISFTFSVSVAELSRPTPISQWFCHWNGLYCRTNHFIWMFSWIYVNWELSTYLPSWNKSELEPPSSEVWRYVFSRDILIHLYCPVESHLRLCRCASEPPEYILTNLVTEQEEHLPTGTVETIFLPKSQVFQLSSLFATTVAKNK